MLKLNARKAVTATAIVAASLGLSGCQALFGPSTASRGEAQNVDMGDYFEGRLAVGRYYLEKGLTTQAITSFRQASYDPRFAGEAYNGMAIAYDQLGRSDLAHRYFSMAVASAPGDDRFSRNLARFENRTPVLPDALPQAQQVELADMDLPELPAIAAAEPQVEKRGPITIGARPATGITVAGRSTGEAVRVSKAEVRVAPAAAPVSAGSVSAGLVSAASPVRTAARGETQSAGRAVISRARRSAAARRGYPVRLVFNGNQASLASQD